MLYNLFLLVLVSTLRNINRIFDGLKEKKKRIMSGKSDGVSWLFNKNISLNGIFLLSKVGTIAVKQDYGLREYSKALHKHFR